MSNLESQRWRPVIGVIVLFCLGLLLTSSQDPVHRFILFLVIASLAALFAFSSHRTQRALEQDATRKRAEQEARAANLAKSEVLAHASHELRTPMNAILGMGDLLLRGDLPREHRDQTEAIVSSAGTLLALIDDVLDYSKIEAGKLALRRVGFDLRGLLREVLQLFRQQAAGKGVDLALEVAGDLPGRLRGDPARIRQVLINLIGNAIKFTPAGTVTVRVERRNLRDDPRVVETPGPALQQAGVLASGSPNNGSRVRFAVHDTGIGISPKDQEGLFAPFARADSTTALKIGGTGLGLVICQRLVELMRGEIGFQSTRGLGSTFWFRLPLEADRESMPAGFGVPQSRPGDLAGVPGADVLSAEGGRPAPRRAGQQEISASW